MRMKRGRLSFLGATVAVVCVVMAGLPLPSQTQQRQAPPPQSPRPPIQSPQRPAPPAKSTPPPQKVTPTVRVTTRLVQISVVAQKNGKPLEGLTADDFVVFDNGKPQPIRVFLAEHLTAPPERIQPREPDTFTNRMQEQEAGRGSVTVVLFDMLNTPPLDQSYARQQVIKFLKQVQPQDRIALYALGTRLRILHDFTNDAEPLLRALEKYKDEKGQVLQQPTAETPSAAQTEMERFLSESMWRVEDMRMAARIEGTLGALEAIANHLAKVPGRKNLVWISAAFPLRTGPEAMTGSQDDTRRTEEFEIPTQRALRAINSANVALYPVDARGMFGNPRGELWRGIPGRPGPFSGSDGMYRGMMMSLDTMGTLADATGGRAFYNTNDISGAIRKAIDDTKITYTLGYYPDHGSWDGKWRKIKVEMKRDGVKIRYRNGYYALGDPPQTKPAVEAELRTAAWSPLESTGMGITVKAARVDVPGAEQLKLEVRVAPSDLRLQQNGGRWQGAVEFYFVTQGEKGQMIGYESERITANLEKDVYDQIMRDGLVLTRTVAVLPGGVKVRVVVREAESGAIGTITVPVGKYFAAKNQQ